MYVDLLSSFPTPPPPPLRTQRESYLRGENQFSDHQFLHSSNSGKQLPERKQKRRYVTISMGNKFTLV
jgi:hypothetical protein